MSLYMPEDLRALAGKAESVDGTYETIADADFNCRIRNIKITPNIEMDDEKSKFATGDHGEDTSIAGAQSADISFDIKCAWSGTAGTVPNWWKYALGCGLKNISYTTTGESLVARKETDVYPMSILVQDSERGSTPVTTLYKFAGAMGNMVLSAEGIGKPLMAKFAFKAKLEDIVDGTALALTSPDTTVAEKFLGATAKIGNTAVCLSSFSLDLGNEVSPVICQSETTGYKYFAVTKRAPRITLNPLAQKQATDDWLATVLASTTASIVIVTTHYTIGIPNAQLVTNAIGAREGLVAWDRTYRALRRGSTALANELTNSAMTAEDCLEILHGTYA
jgi:hypothetical protein